MTNSQNKETRVFRSQIVTVQFRKMSVAKNIKFQEEASFDIFGYPVIILQKRGYVEEWFGSYFYTEDEMANFLEHFADENKIVYNRPKIDIRLSNGVHYWAYFVDDEAMMKHYEEIKNGKTKTIDVTNWN